MHQVVQLGLPNAGAPLCTGFLVEFPSWEDLKGPSVQPFHFADEETEAKREGDLPKLTAS